MSEFNTNLGSDEAPRPRVREAAIALLADLDAAADGTGRASITLVDPPHRSVEALRHAIKFERTAAPEIADPALAQEGIALIRRSAPPGELRPEHIVAVTDAADVAFAQAAWAELRWEADMRAIRRWHEAGNDPMVWPDHADLVLWLLEALEFRPQLPPIGDVQELIAQLDRSLGFGDVKIVDTTSNLRRRSIETIRALAEAVISQGRALYVEQRTVATLGGMVEGLAAEAEQRDGAGRVGSRLDDGQAQGVAYRVGICRVCGCTDQQACMVARDGGDFPCGWADATSTLCDNPHCLAAVGRLDQVSGCEDAIVGDQRPLGAGGPHGDDCECPECWEPVDLAAAVLAHSTATVDLGDGQVEITIRDGVATLPDGSTRNVKVEGGDAK